MTKVIHDPIHVVSPVRPNADAEIIILNPCYPRFSIRGRPQFSSTSAAQHSAPCEMRGNTFRKMFSSLHPLRKDPMPDPLFFHERGFFVALPRLVGCELATRVRVYPWTDQTCWTSSVVDASEPAQSTFSDL